MFESSVLNNGLRVVTAGMPSIRSVTVSFFIGTGSRYETEKEAGVSHFIEHLMFKGTPKRPSAAEICSAIEGVGGLFNGGTDKELTIYWSKVAKPHINLALDVLGDMLLNSRFDPLDVEKERQVIIEEISMSRDMPAQRVGMLMDELLWPFHPLGRDVAGTRKSITEMDRDLILEYRRNHYHPANIVAAVAGDISHGEVVAALDHLLGQWSGSERMPYVPYEERSSEKVSIEKRDTEQTQVCLALPGVSVFDKRRFPLDLLNVILGEGMSSRLFTQIRDKLGLAYSINSYTDHFLDTGSLEIAAGVDSKNLRVAITAIVEELGKLKDPVPESEIYKAKELSKGRMLLRMEDSRAVAGWMGGQEILTSQILAVDEVIAIVDSITQEDLRSLANEVLIGDKLRLAVVGPVDCDEPLADLLKL